MTPQHPDCSRFARCKETAIAEARIPAMRGDRLPNPSVTVVLADREANLSTMDGIVVVDSARPGPQTIRAVLRHRPDVVVLDPCDAGMDIIRDVLRAAPGTAVLVVSALDDDASIRTAVRAGARGYLVKGTDKASIVPAIRGMAAGEVIFGAEIASRIGSLLDDTGTAALTTREQQILDLLLDGLSTAAIARELRLAPKTVRNNLSSIYAKLRVSGRAEAIAASTRS
nr:response regulator transcription factor [Kibdelosporangium sp. MJ126-NF4]CEL20319.1 regulatory protein, LuxR:Response regulator receiver [Kibdelosporangium sp. MJ126-NF4]CTQ97545.1 regulatory protein, LuxR:Response regulator receiver [Kibdelosporangium sp. MJ126-NF4]